MRCVRHGRMIFLLFIFFFLLLFVVVVLFPCSNMYTYTQCECIYNTVFSVAFIQNSELHYIIHLVALCFHVKHVSRVLRPPYTFVPHMQSMHSSLAWLRMDDWCVCVRARYWYNAIIVHVPPHIM